MILACIFEQDELWALIPTTLPPYLTFTWPSTVMWEGGETPCLGQIFAQKPYINNLHPFPFVL